MTEEQPPETARPEADGWTVPADVRTKIAKVFEALDRPVRLEVFTAPGVNDPYNRFAAGFVRDLARLSDKIQAEFFAVDSKQGRRRGVEGSPVVLVAPDRYDIRWRGAPLGEEGRSFLTALLLTSAGRSGLSEPSRQVLAKLDERRQVRVFVTLACPYCPDQVIHAVRCAVERPDLVAAECVETEENRELADALGVGSVPHTFFGTGHDALGLMPQERFVLELVTLQDAEALLRDQAPGPAGDDVPERLDLAIVGGGPAGLTAGIYAVRAGLSAVVLEKGVVGGQVTLTPVVENYPGFASVPGKQLMDLMARQARDYLPVLEGEEVLEIAPGGPDGRFTVRTPRRTLSARGVLLATGATPRRLGAPGEVEYFGRGVNYCATCDGYLYKGGRAYVVGGGNSALTDALHLKHLGVQVGIIHRRDAFRAERHLQDSVAAEGVETLMNTEVKAILGKDGKVTALRLAGPEGEREVPADALFVAVGYAPASDLARKLGVAVDQAGFARAGRDMRTEVPRVYAAGDLTGGVRQIVTAIGSGSVAALSAFEDLLGRGAPAAGHE
ncbi:MAG: FAD-dependent oxidoreductase [Desulfovibrionaceae bacterium]